jgi:hypothetical protein
VNQYFYKKKIIERLFNHHYEPVGFINVLICLEEKK